MPVKAVKSISFTLKMIKCALWWAKRFNGRGKTEVVIVSGLCVNAGLPTRDRWRMGKTWWLEAPCRAFSSLGSCFWSSVSSVLHKMITLTQRPLLTHPLHVSTLCCVHCLRSLSFYLLTHLSRPCACFWASCAASPFSTSSSATTGADRCRWSSRGRASTPCSSSHLRSVTCWEPPLCMWVSRSWLWLWKKKKVNKVYCPIF